jgi:uncharacterized protein YjbI with pentapeptide repeats
MPPTPLTNLRDTLDAANADLSGATMDNVKLDGLRVADAAMRDARITQADLSGATITLCRMDRMTIDGIPVTALLAAYSAMQGG